MEDIKDLVNNITTNEIKTNTKSEKPHKILNYEDIESSTITVISVSNLTINLNNLYKYLPITDYVIIPKKRGRKKKIQYVNPNIDIPVGSIIFIKYKNFNRGVILKKSKNKDKSNYFLNSVTIGIVLENEKIINIKITSNGKFQITGCKDNKHIIKSITYLFHHIVYTQQYFNETIYTLNNNETEPKFIFNTVMRNKDFKIYFDINIQKLDELISLQDDFISLYENNSKSSCINIKYPLNAKYTDTLDCITIDTHKLLNSIPFKIKNNKLFINYKPQLTKIDYNEYLKYETVNKYKQSKKVKEKFHTFLVFQSGAVLQSGCGPEMNEVYNKFINMIVDNRNQIEEVIE
jgi:hypothetical protein